LLTFKHLHYQLLKDLFIWYNIFILTCHSDALHLKFQLANIIWGEAAESGDHIVPYPEASGDYRKKKWNQEAATIKPTEQRTAVTEIDFHDRKLESSSNLNTNGEISTSGFGMDSWPHLSLSNAAKSDQDSMGTGVSNDLTESGKYNSSRGGENTNHWNELHVYICACFCVVCVC
jgi:hypothetical protein